MESMRGVWICLFLVAAALIGPGSGQAPAVDCTSQLAPVAPCLQYVQGSGSAPPKDCCSGLSTLLTSSPVCLCELAEGRLNLSALGVTVDMKRALGLPSACKIKGADRSRCAAILGSPAQAPTAAGPGPAMTSGSDTGTSTTPAAGSPNGAVMAATPSSLALAAAALVAAAASVCL